MSFVTVSFRRRGVFSAIALSLVLTGCGSVSEFTENINPFAREKILKGERQPVFDGADPAADPDYTAATKLRWRLAEIRDTANRALAGE